MFSDILDGTQWGEAELTVPTPVANSGYYFNGWTPLLPKATDAITEDLTFTANFAQSGGDGGGSNGGGGNDGCGSNGGGGNDSGGSRDRRDRESRVTPSIVIVDEQIPLAAPVATVEAAPQEPAPQEVPEATVDIPVEEVPLAAPDLPNTGAGINPGLMALNGLTMVFSGLLLKRRSKKNNK